MLEFLQMVTGIFVVVYDGQDALKFHLGRAIGVVGPGVHFKIPIIQRFQFQPTKDTTYRQFHDEQKLSSEAAVSLISGAVVALPAQRAGARAGAAGPCHGADLGPAGRRSFLARRLERPCR